jgi:hypothetical protein
MNDFDDLDDLIGPLRSSATPAELAGESEMVALMAHAHRTAKGNTMFTSRRARVATLIAAGVIGFGGVAAAGPGGFSLTGSEDGGPTIEDTTTTTTTEVPAEDVIIEEVTTTTEDSTTTTTDAVEEIDAAIAEVAASDVLPLVDDPTTAFNEEYCEPGNHGKTVSKAAHGQLMVPNTAPDAVEGDMVQASVVDAAHSMCGKMDDTADTEEPAVDETEVEAVEETDQTDAEQPTKQHGKPESPGNSAKGSSNGNGNGNGKGKSGK